jgi:hypothetical protein
MPNRIIKESICTSDEIDKLTAEEEVFFYRLMVIVDDFGLIDARIPILKSKCYPLKSIDINVIQANLASLVAVGLVNLYRVEGKPYLSITNWAKHQQIRAQRAKYPMPDEGVAITCNQLISDAPVIQSNPIQSESNLKTEKQQKKRAIGADIFPEISNRQIVNDWIEIRKLKKLATTKTALEGFIREVNISGLSLESVLTICCENSWGGFKAKWLNEISNDARIKNDNPFEGCLPCA